jgi:hypothetical protein
MSEKQLLHPPRFVQNEQGEIIDVIVSYDDYRQFLRALAAHVDWATLRTPRLNLERHGRSVPLWANPARRPDGLCSSAPACRGTRPRETSF